MEEGIRVKVNEKEQRSLFKEFIKKFKNKTIAAGSIGISKYNLYDYENCKTKFIPQVVLDKVSSITNISPIILDKKTLIEIRRIYAKRATRKLKEKYGKNWIKVLNKSSKRAMYKKYGKKAYKIITKRGHQVLESKYGKEWRKIISKKGIEKLREKYDNRWDNLRNGRNKLMRKYGKNWPSKLSKRGDKALRKKYGKNVRQIFGYRNIDSLLKNRRVNETELFIQNYLKKNKIEFEANFVKNNLEFDIVIPNGKDPEYVIEISNIKPMTYNQRMKILHLYYQKKTFPKSQHIAILRFNCCDANGNHRLPRLIKDFLDKEGIILLSLEKINKYMPILIRQIKNGSILNIEEDLGFSNRSMGNSIVGCLGQTKSMNINESKLHKLLMKIGAIASGPKVLKVKGKSYICVDNFEIYKNNRIAYEITSSNSMNSMRALAGKILLCKRFNKIKFIVVVDNNKVLENTQLKFLREISDYVILKKQFNEEELIKARSKIS